MSHPDELVFYTRAGCHLCDDARPLVVQLCRESGVPVREVDVDSDPALRERYGEMVPVVAVDGQVVTYLRVDGQRVRTALAGQGGGRAPA
jgi:glutaredoxin